MGGASHRTRTYGYLGFERGGDILVFALVRGPKLLFSTQRGKKIRRKQDRSGLCPPFLSAMAIVSTPPLEDNSSSTISARPFAAAVSTGVPPPLAPKPPPLLGAAPLNSNLQSAYSLLNSMLLF